MEVEGWSSARRWRWEGKVVRWCMCVGGVCVRVLVHVYLHICLCLSRLVCPAAVRLVWGRACLQTLVRLGTTPPLPSRSSPRVSSESVAHSCGTRLISSVIKINEVLIAAVIYANDCGTQDEDFLSLLQSEGESGIWCVIASQQLSAANVAVVIVCYDGGDSGGQFWW